MSLQFADLPAANAGEGVDEALRLISQSLPADCVALYLRTGDATSFVEIARFGQAPGEGYPQFDQFLEDARFQLLSGASTPQQVADFLEGSGFMVCAV